MLKMRPRKVRNAKSRMLSLRQCQMTKIPMSQGFEFGELGPAICLGFGNQDSGFDLREVRHEIYY